MSASTSGWTSRFRQLWHAQFFSPKDFIRRAVLLSLLYTLVCGMGLKDFTSVLNGTTGSVEMDWRMSAFLGVGYVMVYLAFVLVVPVFVLAAGILTLWNRFGTSQSIATTENVPASAKSVAPAAGSLADSLKPFFKQ